MDRADVNVQHRSRPRICLVRAGKLYDVTEFAGRHPGGRDLLEKHAGQDVDVAMRDGSNHIHSKAAYSIMEKYLVGAADSLTQNGRIMSITDTASRLDDYYKNDIVDWSRPMLNQVGYLGDKYFDWTHQQVDRPIRLFESDLAEMMTRAYWWFVPITWLPVMAFSLWNAFTILSDTAEVWCPLSASIHIKPATIPALFVSGVFFWTFLEYVIHRWLFHLRPPADWPLLIRLHFSLHGQHHKSPMDPTRLVFPPLPASVFGALIFLGCRVMLPTGAACALFAGVVVGYVAYDVIHYYIHHGGQPRVAYFQRLKSYHAKHHYQYQQLGFGISSKMWDYPFGTLIPEEKDL